MNLVNINTNETITTLKLREMINEARTAAGESEIRNNDFMSRVMDEIDDLGVYETFVSPSNGQEMRFYALTIEQATLVGMRESKAVRRAVLDVIKKFAKPVSLPTFPELLRQHADALDQLALAAPKVEHFDKYVARDGMRNLTDVAKSMGMSAVKLGRLLREHGMAFKRTDKMVWMQWFVDKGYGVTKQIIANDKDRDQAMITNTGDAYLKAQFAKDGLEGLL